jgi:hypothetical protein
VRSPSTSPPVHPAANGNLEFFRGANFLWPFLMHQAGSSGTSGAHTSS